MSASRSTTTPVRASRRLLVAHADVPESDHMQLIMRNSALTRTTRAHRGITLPEMMVVLVLLGLVVGGLMTVLVRQQRFYTGTSEIIQTKGSARQAIDILSSELRGISTGTRGGAPNAVDIYAMSDWSASRSGRSSADRCCARSIRRARSSRLPPRDMARAEQSDVVPLGCARRRFDLRFRSGRAAGHQ